MDNKKDKIVDNALLFIIINSLSEIDDLDTICNYNFDISLHGNRLKGVVTVEFEEVE